MAPPKKLVAVQHRVRRMHPLATPMSRELRRIATANPDEIRAFQEGRLRAMTRWAAVASPFYRQWFRREKVDPRGIRTLDDLRHLPVLRRNDLMERPETFRAYPARTMWEAHSSGTSSRAVTVYRTPGSSVYEMRVLERQWSWFGLPHAPHRVTLGGSDFAADRPGNPTEIVPGARQLLVSSYRLTPDDLPTIVRDIRRFGPDAIDGWPSSICLLAELLYEHGERLPMRAVLTSSETMRSAQRALIREVFGGPIVDHYGQTERVAMAGTCEAGTMHIFPDYGIVELEPVPGVPDRWEIIGTPLHNWGFPIFRYRTGDLVGPAPAGGCACGRAFPTLGALDGRVEDAFTTVDGRPLPLPSTVIDDVTGVREAQIAQLAPGRFEIRMVPGVGFDAERIEQQYRRNVERLFGPGQELRVVTLDAVPRTASGKLKTAVVEGGGDRAVPAAVAEAFAGYRLGPGE
ncbi:phenylacetate--CoA ligase family protein [Rhodococcus sp. PD04]|uniref:phenylacetate--CoA ligase family protein n=1 Tax=Rhodococcus sp. PD04 TaxID=3109594 RepID=UPI002DD8E7FF|nr:phenylacetate--CoA ligase family protein [Rhodococcus sp. PD04]WSE22924.1 phenylacetate--CoA ligase family protein [Rhodococcus sp. PD04]